MKTFDRRGPLALAASALGVAFVSFADEANTEFGTTTVVDIRGPLTRRGEGFFDSYDAIEERVRAALASSAKAVMLRLDSPGGDVGGCFELAGELREMATAAGKPLVAYVDGMACSAAYALATAADSIWVPPTGRVGSIGVINAMVSQVGADRAAGLTFAIVASGARKADGCPHVEITDDAIGAMQRDVDSLAGQFFQLVAERRLMTPAKVAALQAGTFVGSDAVAVGLADKVGIFEDVLAMLASGEATGPAMATEDSMDYEKAVAALRALAEGEGEEADKARKALKAIDGLDEEKAESTEEEPKGEDHKEPDGDEPKGEDEKKEPDGDEAPKAAAKAEISLAAKVVELDRRFKAIETRSERERLLASRPDLMKQSTVKAWLSSAPIETVREAVRNIPKPSIPKPAAATTVQPTLGEGQGAGRANALPPTEANELDIKMGLASKPQGIRREGKAVIFSVMTAEDARRRFAELNGGAK